MAFVVFWGTFFPLISEAITGEKHALGPPWFGKYIVPLAIVLVLLSGIGPLHRPGGARRRPTLRRNFAAAGARRLRRGRWSLLLVGGGARGRAAMLMFAACALPAGLRRPGVLARHARPARDERRGAAGRARVARAPQPPALRRLPRARRAWRCCSSASPRPRPSSTSRRRRCRSGQTANVGGYAIHYDRPTATSPRATGGWRRSTSARPDGAQGRQGRHAAAHRARLLPDRRQSLGAVEPLLRGRGDQRGRAEGRARCATSGRRSQPDTDPLKTVISQGDKVFGQGARTSPPQMGRAARPAIAGHRRPLQEQAAAGAVPRHRLAAGDLDLARRDRSSFGGGLIALWPAARRRPPPRPRRLRRRAWPASSAAPSQPVDAWTRSSSSSLLAVVVWRGQRAAARAARPRGRAPSARGAPTSRRPRRPSTARSATPSSTGAPASSPTSRLARAVDRQLRAEAVEILRARRAGRAGDR